MIAGSRSFAAIGQWAADAGPEILAVLGAVRGPAEEFTFRRAFALVSADVLDRVLSAWPHTRVVQADGRPAPPGLLAKLGNAGRPAGRDESGTVAEAGPAASLEHWDIPCRGYKQPRNLSALTEVVTGLQPAAPLTRLTYQATSPGLRHLRATSSSQSRT